MNAKSAKQSYLIKDGVYLIDFLDLGGYPGASYGRGEHLITSLSGTSRCAEEELMPSPPSKVIWLRVACTSLVFSISASIRRGSHEAWRVPMAELGKVAQRLDLMNYACFSSTYVKNTAQLKNATDSTAE